ncbi:MAG: hypothetical protein MJ177_11160, partial [Clostridia bacterium]|nr:hypothetical protein [Clostridia bacterium]
EQEGYDIAVKGSQLFVRASDDNGLFYGCAEVVKQLKKNGRVGSVHSAPDTAERALFLDIARKYYTPLWIKELIKELESSRMNTLVLHFSEEKYLKVCHRAARDNARTPMQWDDSENAGFTAGEPWFYVNPNYRTINVKQAEEDENSILNYYRKLLKFRKENPIVIYGDYKEHNKSSRDLFVYERSYEGKRMLVMCCFSEESVAFTAPKDFDLTKAQLVLSNYSDNPVIHNGFMTKPYETRVYLLG